MSPHLVQTPSSIRTTPYFLRNSEQVHMHAGAGRVRAAAWRVESDQALLHQMYCSEMASGTGWASSNVGMSVPLQTTAATSFDTTGFTGTTTDGAT
eukprot:3511304-Prymnesium_polylepis.1